MTSIRLEKIEKHFGATIALHPLSLQINAGELFFLLGPSGCGKSTLLRTIAGLIEPTAGRIFFNDRDVTSLPTDRRNAVMCFQNYALWPHLSVRENVRFGLDVRKIERAKRDARVDYVLDLVKLLPLADRKPNELSGGQQQRVALARSIAVEPACLLLDEPLSNLDAQLRASMRKEIRQICKSSGLTTVYVTHDQKEALSTADRIAVMKDGRLMQVGTAAEIYQSPVDAFVAGFLGATNLITGKVSARANGNLIIATTIGNVAAIGTVEIGADVTLSIRPENVRIVSDVNSHHENSFRGEIIESTFLGESSEHTMRIGNTLLKFTASPPRLDLPRKVEIDVDPSDVVLIRE